MDQTILNSLHKNWTLSVINGTQSIYNTEVSRSNLHDYNDVYTLKHNRHKYDLKTVHNVLNASQKLMDSNRWR